ncbi:double-strand break repair protein AddB [Jannaschia ovalis]|uniref:Double-strand break repair protein AddB n=1 Tax=Jannaschia ovalis TaxID=3038773 RepID=A0ABY8LGE0_9RHOB|nr:double-strand break repair protein AddB [Jannaschia sp. GRR-S6-38]WGH80367.1 double-strand break repair protein AddB [Jannaschia sp. GRR-S6-38]
MARRTPGDPVIVAGSTASRAPTRALITAVTALPQGAVILPGLDRDMPEPAWTGLLGDGHGPAGAQDHPQYRHAALLADLGLARDDVPRWDGTAPAAPARNRLLSLALRPAPATDAWREEGPHLADVAAACAGITLLEAPTPGAEATTVALGLRAALAEGRRAALITPDRQLSRQVAAQLDRWGIEPDDSAGIPLGQSLPGRLLLMVADLRAPVLDSEALVALLKHPLTASGWDRPAHLARVRALELDLLRRAPIAFPDRRAVADWAGAEADEWTAWLCDLLDRLAPSAGAATLAEHAADHLEIAEHAARGPAADGAEDAVENGAGDLWKGVAGACARGVLRDLCACAGERGGAPLPPADHARILHGLIAAEEVREAVGPHPDVMIWGALEARVRTADRVILGGLVDGIWPDHPGADPWLNRAMRAQAGLRLPDRTVGLSAHDFQQAAAGAEIWLSRALRDDEAETVPSRWLNRLTGLLDGLGGEAAAALEAMRARGDGWLAQAARLSEPDARHPATLAPRPAPKPPTAHRPTRLSVTAVETLIRDPYAIYARAILGLRALDPLRQGPDARLRGSAIHDAMERFAREVPGEIDAAAADRLRAALEQTLASQAPWPGFRRLWLGKFDRMLPDFLRAEAARRAAGRPIAIERGAELAFDDPPFTLTARADRMDHRGDAVAIYDYKTGKPPTAKQQEAFAKQLLLEALMVTRGAFGDLPPRVAEVAYLGVGASYKEETVAVDAAILAETDREFRDLVGAYAEGRPYIARLAPDVLTFASDYDQLSRFGEWDDTQDATTIPVGRA